MYAHVVLTSRAGTLVPTLGFCPLGMAIQWFQAYTHTGFVVATGSALKPRAYFSLRALAHYLEREVRSDHQVFQLRLVGTLSALPLDSSRRDAAGFSIRTLSRVVPLTSPGALVLNTVCCPYLQLA